MRISFQLCIACLDILLEIISLRIYPIALLCLFLLLMHECVVVCIQEYM